MSLIDRQAAIDAPVKMVSEGLEWIPVYHIKDLPSAQPDNSCDGCRYENADDGVLVPCGFCKRSHPDNYER